MVKSWLPSGWICIPLVILGVSRVHAQSEPLAPDSQPNGQPERTGQTTADEEVTVIGQRSPRLLRLEVQAARERVYGLFNSLNSDDDFDIECRNLPRTGTRILQRVCRPHYADRATHSAGSAFARSVQSDCFDPTTGAAVLGEGCMATGISRSQAVLSEVPIKDRQLDEEIQRLARDNPEFRRAIASFQGAELRYDEARGVEPGGLRVSASIIDGQRESAAIPSDLNLRSGDITAPVPIDLTTPAAPWGGVQTGPLREGWVKLRYSVLADGKVADVSVVDTMPPGLDAAAAVMAAQSWTFEPAMADGDPVDWQNNVAVITVSREQTIHVGWLAFAEAYEAVAALAADARYEEAMARNERMQRDLAATLEEMAFAEMQLAGIEQALGDRYAALDAIRRATQSGIRQLADEQLKLALEHRFELELQLGLSADALRTYKRWTGIEDHDSHESMTHLGATLEEALLVPDTSLVAQGRIGDNMRWEHRMTWPVFAVGNVDGRVDGLGLVCNRGKAELPLEADVQMTIPSGWGKCVLIANGQADTTFAVYEFQAPVD